MKKITLLTFLICVCFLSNAQFSTGVVNLDGAAQTVKIDTDATTVTLTLTGPSSSWLGIGFGGSGNMTGVQDFFIWNASANRDYSSTGGTVTPSVDVASQSWTIVSDNVLSSVRTVIATRPLVSVGDFTFLNNNSNIQIIYARGNTTTLAYHGNNPHSGLSLTRTSLSAQNFSLNETSVYPNPSNGSFNVLTKTSLDKINVYSQTGQFIKTIDIIDKTNKVDLNIKGLSTGIYLIELQNATEKSWKKVIIE